MSFYYIHESDKIAIYLVRYSKSKHIEGCKAMKHLRYFGRYRGFSEYVHIWYLNTYCDFALISYKINPYHRTSFGAIQSQKFAKVCEKSMLRSNYMLMTNYFVTLHLFGK